MKKTFAIGLPGILAALLLIGGIVYGPEIAGRFAYAVEAGKVEALRSELAEMSKKDHLSPLFRMMASVVSPAVVEVRVTKKVEHQMPPDLEDFFRRFREDGEGLPRVPEGRRREFYARGLGSGFVVDAKNGYIITNYHVVAEADEVEVVLGDGRKFSTEWVRSDPQTDLAVIKIDAQRLHAVDFGDSDEMQPGDIVMAIGAPRGLAQTVTTGIISAKGRSNQGGQPGMYQDYIQTDAAINRGNSGGPLINTRGQVIGVNNSIMSYSGGFEGIGFAIPSNMIKRIMGQLVDKGKVTRGFLGVAIQDVNEGLAKSFKLPSTRGALVSQVTEDSPAAKAGIKVGDFLTAVNGDRVEDVNSLRNRVAAIDPGRTVEIELYRDGKKMTVKAKLVVQPADMNKILVPGEEGPREVEVAKKYGLMVSNVSQELREKYGYKDDVKGVIVTGVDPGSNAAEEGLAPGMVITNVQDKEIKSVQDFEAALPKDAAGVRLRVMDRTGGQRFVFVTPMKDRRKK